jgi:hypothetical protein
LIFIPRYSFLKKSISIRTCKKHGRCRGKPIEEKTMHGLMDKKNDNDKPTGNGMPLQELK